MYGCSVVPDELKTADRLIETAPDSALQILQHISPNLYKKPAHHALYGLLLVRLMDKLHLPLKSDSLLDYSLNYYFTHPDNEQLASCYLFKGRNYKNNLQYDKAMDFYLKGLSIAQRTNDNLLLGRFNLDMGDIYLIQRDYSLSRQKYKYSFDYFTKIKLQPQAFYSFLNIGRTYHAAGDYTIAQRFYQKGYNNAADSLEKASVLQEIAINFYDRHQFDSAMICFRQVIHYPYLGNNKAVRYSYFADLFLDLKQIDSATFYAKNAFNFYPDIVTQRECYRILTNVGYLKGNIRQMKMYMNQYIVLFDSVHKIENQSKGSLIESIHSSKMEVIKTKNSQWYLVGFVLVGILIVLILIIQLRKLSILEIQKTEIHYQQQKTGIRIDVLTKHSETILQKIEAVKSKQSSERKKASMSDKEKLDRKIYDEILHMNDMDFFFNEMDTVLNNLVSKLRTRYPALTSKEISWCCLYLLHIPTTDIYLLLDYKVGSLKKMKQRLAQKIIVPGIKGIDDFLTGILSE
jgi:tetratricopeptide (TPR) repeat protein